MTECFVLDNLISVRRNLRWLKDNCDRHSIQADEVLSQSYELLRETELDCLAKRNDKKCLANKEE